MFGCHPVMSMKKGGVTFRKKVVFGEGLARSRQGILSGSATPAPIGFPKGFHSVCLVFSLVALEMGFFKDGKRPRPTVSP